ncbi:MAG TPA: ROK family protein [Spirochaetia bacterium]|nr:ROK family protein [Spirochaetia bacterium]
MKTLLQKGLVERSGKTRNRSGRPSAMYRLASGVGYSIGISVDLTGCRITAVDPRLSTLWEGEFPLCLSGIPSDHLNEIVGTLSAELKKAMSSLSWLDRRPLAIGVSLPGMVDTERGVWLQGLQVSGITRIPIRTIMERTFGLPVVVESPARCLAFLTSIQRWPQASGDIVYLSLGSGVGTAVIIGEEPYQGSHGLAGAIGHLVVDKEGERCSCGNVGCLETVASRPGILKRFRQRLSEGVISSLQYFNEKGAGLTLEAIREAALSGDRLAKSTLLEIGVFLGDACSKIVTLYNPRGIVLGGPVATLGELLQEPIMNTIRQKVLPEMLESFSLDVLPSGPRDEALGAALLAERRFWKNAAAAGIAFD